MRVLKLLLGRSLFMLPAGDKATAEMIEAIRESYGFDQINRKNQGPLACRGEAELHFEGGSHESLVKAEPSPTRGQRNSRGEELLALIETQHGHGTVG